MELEKQVCSLEQAKRLNELGVVQESHCHWVSSSTMLPEGYHLTVQGVSPFKDTSRFADSASAFTVAELGVMLGKESDSCYFNGDGWFYLYDFECIRHETEAQARAAYLIHLLETGQLTVEEVNRRLTA